MLQVVRFSVTASCRATSSSILEMRNLHFILTYFLWLNTSLVVDHIYKQKRKKMTKREHAWFLAVSNQ